MYLHIVAAAYTYYRTLCAEGSLKRRGKFKERNQSRRRRERAIRVSENFCINNNLTYINSCIIDIVDNLLSCKQILIVNFHRSWRGERVPWINQ